MTRSTIPLYQIDAFAERPFEGNPAAVCPLESWLDDATMQAIAAENNLSETAFLVGSNGDYDLRWFTPRCEVALCGHATLASAEAVFSALEPDIDEVRFQTKSGVLTVRKDQGRLAMDFPARPANPVVIPDGLAWAMGAQPLELRTSTDDWMVVVADAASVRDLKPDFHALATFPFRGLIVTAKGGESEGDGIDFVSRFFAPSVGIDEDPVTGSAHCVLVPYWAKRLKKDTLTARQLSSRGGTLYCRLLGEGRVEMAGTAVSVIEGVFKL